MGVLVLKPPEALSEGPFDLSFHRIHFIASNPLFPPNLRISQAPRLRERRPCRNAFSFLQLQVPIRTHMSLSIGSTISSETEIIRPRGSIVALYLHHLPICIRPWSLKLLHGKLGRKERRMKDPKGLSIISLFNPWPFFFLLLLERWSKYEGQWWRGVQQRP